MNQDLEQGQESERYMLFALGEESYGVPILKIQEIISPHGVTRVPRTPKYLSGVMNLRGKIVPVIDLRNLLYDTTKEFDSLTCFLVMRASLGDSELSVGLVVDGVLGVQEFSHSEIQPRSADSESTVDRVIRGIALQDKSTSFLIDVDEICRTVKEECMVRQNKKNTGSL